MFDVVTIGGATEDVFAIVKQTVIVRVEDARSETAYMGLAYGAKIPVDNVEITTGGGSTNAAVGLARMGLKTRCVSKLGKDGPGDRVVAALESEKVDTGLMCRSDDHCTAYSVIITCFTGERTILSYRGAAEQLTMDDLDLDALLDTKWLFLGSMRGPAASLYFKLPEAAVARGVKVGANPGNAQLALGLDGLGPALKNMEIVFVNKDEAYALTGVAPDPSRVDEHRMLQAISETGCGHVVITDGDEGADGYDGESYYYVPAYKAKVASTVGAGDSFAAGCLAAILRGMPLGEAMKIGSANAASVIESVGAKAGLLTWDQATSVVASRQPGE